MKSHNKRHGGATVSYCRWPHCRLEAVTIIGTTLLGTYSLCKAHRRIWLALSYKDQAIAAAEMWPYRMKTVGGPTTYSPIGAETIGRMHPSGWVID